MKFEGKFLNEKDQEIHWKFYAENEQDLKAQVDKLSWKIISLDPQEELKAPSDHKALLAIPAAILVLFIVIPVWRINTVCEKGTALVKSIEDYRTMRGKYPPDLKEVGYTSKDFIYAATEDGKRFEIQSVSFLLPLNRFYSSEKHKWLWIWDVGAGKDEL